MKYQLMIYFSFLIFIYLGKTEFKYFVSYHPYHENNSLKTTFNLTSRQIKLKGDANVHNVEKNAGSLTAALRPGKLKKVSGPCL